jgi:uncharacterized protein
MQEIKRPRTTPKREVLKRGLLIAVGTVSLGFACLGIILPVLPTTPFLLLTAACYLRSSKRMHTWLLNNKIFGQYIKNYVEGKGISAKAKISTLTLMWIAISYALITAPVLVMQVALLVIASAVTVHIIRVPTYKQK